MTNTGVAVYWFRRDLRLDDNAALYHALKSGYPVLTLFIFDKEILDKLEDKNDSRVTFIYEHIKRLHQELSDIGSSIVCYYGKPIDVWKKVVKEYNVKAVYTNHDYEPYAIERDNKVANLLREKSIQFHTYKDQVIFEKNEVLKDDGTPYTVYTPYSKKWMGKLNSFYLKPYPTQKYWSNFLKSKQSTLPTLEDMGFQKSNSKFSSAELPAALPQKYAEQRNYPALDGTSHMSVHLRFGTISIRKIASKAQKSSFVFLNELCWREFYMMILWHFPHVVNSAFKKQYNNIHWRNNVEEFNRWCTGQTGFPIVDAGMRQLNQTGFMHNRVRMIVASFLTKDLLIDWRWGEAYFASRLLDYELASNNGGWQWAAGCGCDAAPYFRIFNPAEQTKKFDPDLKYIRKWVPEFEDFSYPSPIVDHKLARERCLQSYRTALQKSS